MARTALEIIHIRPGTGADLRRAPGRPGGCERAATTACSPTATSTSIHLIDRHRDRVLPPARSPGRAVPGRGRARERQDAQGRYSRTPSAGAQVRRWLSAGLPPARRRSAQVAEALARPDLVYDLTGSPVAVFVDGPHHDVRPQRRATGGRSGWHLGWLVVRVRHDDDCGMASGRAARVSSARDGAIITRTPDVCCRLPGPRPADANGSSCPEPRRLPVTGPSAAASNAWSRVFPDEGVGLATFPALRPDDLGDAQQRRPAA